MLGTLLRLPPAACKQWSDALALLPPDKLQHVAKDPGGCRVLEAYLEVRETGWGKGRGLGRRAWRLFRCALAWKCTRAGGRCGAKRVGWGGVASMAVARSRPALSALRRER